MGPKPKSKTIKVKNIKYRPGTSRSYTVFVRRGEGQRILGGRGKSIHQKRFLVEGSGETWLKSAASLSLEFLLFAVTRSSLMQVACDSSRATNLDPRQLRHDMFTIVVYLRSF